MNKPALFFISFILAAGLSAAELAQAPGPIDVSAYDHSIRVACVGDSLTLGVRTTRGFDYPSQLGQMLGSRWEVKNFGRGGATLGSDGDIPYERQPQYTQAIQFRPDVVVIMLGTNDTRPANWGREKDFVGDYGKLIESFQNLDSHCRIYICRPPAVVGRGGYGITNEHLQKETADIEKVAAAKNLQLIDLRAPLLQHPELYHADNVHVLDKGASVIAQTVYYTLTGQEFTGKP